MKISPKATYKLTLLWAFAESGLGGLLHGLHVPVTGFVLGAFSVVIISLIACYSTNQTRDILTSTLLVLVVKFSVSPHSPLPAYVALLFQGCVGAIMFKLFRYNAFSLISFSIIAMVESAIQKPLLATIIFGKELWLAVDEYVNKLLVLTTDQTFTSFSIYFLSTYTILYAVWGVVVGIWAYKLPIKLAGLSVVEQSIINVNTLQAGPKRKRWFFIGIFLVILLLLAFYVFDMPTPLLYITRTIIIVVLIYFLITPIVRYFLKRFTAQHHSFIANFNKALPELKITLQKANQFASSHKGLYKRWSTFLLYLLYLNLQDETS
ncbi:hypothetical protein SanaruYs_30220 [Chryseotalea sanaruensis]|uniref:Uncharacterized protein n=1 Tax=Chryseotalea sanaruensis TaxID=2482724 RepID=A0A401UD32_9BACT|nr:hypothetical protein [Chryseotalea sanaruensis]GCC52783.1 hypothetical protein SanaruYs_30220 [Chryseotalea sanaruensis]